MYEDSITSKIVVFDLDETLGYFLEFGLFWSSVIEYYKIKNPDKKVDQEDFNKLLDLYPEFLRPDVLYILNYLKHKKERGLCKAVMIYTNNQGPKEWAPYIKNYFENKLKFSLFDRIIGAFKINGKLVEICRTCEDKTLKDFVKCTKIPENTEIFFIDDIYYPEMDKNNVYYITINPYKYDLSFDTMIKRFLDSKYGKMNVKDDNKVYFQNFMLEYMKKEKHRVKTKDNTEYEIDEILTKKIIEHLHIFFYEKWREEDIIKVSKKIKSAKNVKNKNAKNRTLKKPKNKV